MADASHKLKHLRQITRDCRSLLIAFSGGVDSSVVMAVAAQELGTCALACTAVSPSFPSGELERAALLAHDLGCRHRIVETQEHQDPNYLSNTADRCFHCKSHLFRRLAEIAAVEGYGVIADGVHADDLKDHAGGITAARKFGVRSPLLEAELNKPEIRSIARELNLPVADKPATPCLASRIPRGTPVTIESLARIDSAEEVLHRLGFSDVRVRHQGNTARLELPQSQFAGLLLQREKVIQELYLLGYAHVALDLKGR